MLFYQDLEEIIFHRHEMFDVDELVVLSGYLGPQPIHRLSNLPFRTSVIYGMYGIDRIGERLHKSLIELNMNIANIDILYSNLPIHAKCYIWKKESKIVTALVGSANFSVSGLSNSYKEVLAETTYDTFGPLSSYLHIILDNCIKCTDENVKLKYSNNQEAARMVVDTTEVPAGVCRESLLDRYGNVPEKSGLNWGLSHGHTTLGDAYIKISTEDIKGNPALFPPKQLEESRTREGGRAGRQNDAVEFIWDDGEIMEGLLEGTQFVDGIPYPKQISSSPRKNILGIYLRHRLGLDLNHLITRRDLESYGRTHIDISLLGEGIYYMDFSVK